ncbi:LORF2 protein, partial [Crocuta crocuta]
MCTVALFIIGKTWKQPRCRWMDEWGKKMSYIYRYTHTMEYYSAIKENKILLFVTTWIDLESV